ncbi:MAG: UvrD-helicase domain-containing protein [Bacteroidota bacterium]
MNEKARIDPAAEPVEVPAHGEVSSVTSGRIEALQPAADVVHHDADALQHDADALQQDIAARETAIDKVRSFIVQAPAGSGKTELLIQRYLSLLATVDAPEEIIAITFTRKAATEMRVRILEALRAAGEKDAETAHARRTQQLAREALARDAAMRWSLREQPGRMRILTIDALNGWITRQMPWLSGLGPISSVTDDSAGFYHEAVRSVLLGEAGGAALRSVVRSLLVHLDNRFTAIEDLLAGMLAIRDQWIALVEGGLDSLAARTVLETTLQRIIISHLEKLSARFTAAQLGEGMTLAAHAAEVLNADPERSGEAMQACLGFEGTPTAQVGDIPLWLGLRQILLTDSDDFRKPRGITIRQGFAAKDPMKDRLIALIQEISEDDALRELLGALRLLPAAQFDDAQWDVVGSMVTILAACVDELRPLFSRRSATDHIEVAASARKAMGSELEPTDLSMMLEYRIRHLLVDEFQDTSSSQFLLLAQLTAGWSAPDQHTLFLVGDPMQSIYRFREAEVGLFLQVWQEQRLGSVPLTALRLTRNFRSQAGIVSWVNDVFSHMMPEASDPAAGAVAYAPSIPVHDAEGKAAEIRMVFSGNRKEEAGNIAALLRQVLDGAVCRQVDSVAVLVRARSHLADIVPALRAEGVRFRAVEIEALGKSSAVQDILALTRALLFPADRIAWLAVLRAPYCGMTLADLHALCRNDEHTPLRTLLRNSERLEKMSPDGRARAERISAALSNAAARRGRTSLRSYVEGCWIALGAPALIDAGEVEAATAFLSLLEQHDEGGDLDDAALLEQSAGMLYAPPDPEGDARLQLMTVHKAKGLQFDVVVIPRLDGVPRPEQDRLLLWDRSLGDEGLAFLIAPLRARGGAVDSIYSYIKKSRAKKAEHEYVRMLYVAATRAKRRLYLSATLKESEKSGELSLKNPASRSFLFSLWPVLQEEIEQRYADWRGKQDTEPAREASASVSASILQRVPEGWLPPELPPDAVYHGGEKQDEALRYESSVSDLAWRAGHGARAAGVVVHALLHRVAVEGKLFWRNVGDEERRAMLRAMFVDAGLLQPEKDVLERASSAIDRVLADEKGRWILDRHEHAECELALTGYDGESILGVRIDRTFVTADGVRWIVDYKTSSHEGADLEEFLAGQEKLYRPQLERYARMMKVWDGRPVRAALYYPLLQRWREVSLGE